MNADPPERWREVGLGDLIQVHHGFAFQGEHFREGPPGDILLTPGNFAVGGGFTWAKRKYYDGPVDERFVLKAGDLLISMTDLSKGADTLGSPALVPAAPDGTRLLHNQRLGRVEITDPDELDLGYLYAVLRTADYRYQIVASATGTTVKHTSPAKIGAASIPLPPFRAQQRIASVVGALDDKIDSNRRFSQPLEQVAETEFRARFVDFVGIDKLVPSEIGPIPDGWAVAPVGEELKVVGGTTPSTKEPEYWHGGTHCWATPKDLSGLASPVLLDTERHITDDGLSRISSGLLPKRTVLLSSRAPVGYTAIGMIETAVNQGFIAIPPNGSIPSEYVFFWVRANLDLIKEHAGGTTFAEISKRAFRPLPMLVPPSEDLKEFEGIARPLIDSIAGHRRECLSLAAIRDALLPKLVSGEISMPDSVEPTETGERLVEEPAA